MDDTAVQDHVIRERERERETNSKVIAALGISSNPSHRAHTQKTVKLWEFSFSRT
jgi:hypothetical protein